MPPEGQRQALLEAAGSLGVGLSEQQTAALLGHLSLLAKWNQVYNLTAVRDPAAMLQQHLVDSLAVVPPLNRWLASLDTTSPRLLDVGSGAGLPGIVLAIALPHLQVSCIDTVGKKASFIRQAAAELGVRGLQAVHGRVEQMRAEPFDVITSRAFASLADFVGLTRHLLRSTGCWMAMKAKLPQDEIDTLPEDIEVFHVEPLQVPGLDADRCLVWMRPRPSPQKDQGRPS
jgi:16S rRNA (guanine527-N7)-methyltransferase